MSHFTFFKRTESSGEKEFQSKLAAAIELIKENKSLVAMKVLEVLNTKKLVIQSFYGLTKDHFLEIISDMKREDHIHVSTKYPPPDASIHKIERKLDGMIFNNKYVYMNSSKTPEQIASTLVHEVGHFLNSSLCAYQRKQNDPDLVSYSDEVRSFTAEKMFERNGACLRRSDIASIHEKVTNLYPEFVEDPENAQKLGYIFSIYDSPEGEQSRVLGA